MLNAPTMNRRWIAAHIPHQGAMCLLEGVRDWSTERIVCTARSHTQPGNPLWAAQRLGAAAAIEYAAQAMAVHGALLAPAAAPPRSGYLTSVRDVRLHVLRLDDCAAVLEVIAERLSGNDQLIVYHFEVRQGERCLADGRASVVLDAGSLHGGARA
mgnify:CR=1 FL=1